MGAVARRLRIEHVLPPKARVLEALTLPRGYERGTQVRVQARLVPRVHRRRQRKAVLDEQEIVGVRAVPDKQLVARHVRLRGGDGEEAVVKGDGAPVGRVVEQVRHGLQHHVVLLGPLLLRLPRRVVKRARVDEQPRVEEVFLADFVARLREGRGLDGGPVLVEFGALLGEEGGGGGWEESAQLGGPADGERGVNVLLGGEDAAPGEEVRGCIEAERGGEDGVHGGAGEGAGDGGGCVGYCAEGGGGDFEDDLVCLERSC